MPIAELSAAVSLARATVWRPNSAGDVVCLPWRECLPEIAAWDELAACAAEPNPFLESWFLLPGLRALEDTGAVYLIRYEKRGRLLGLLPVLRPYDYHGWPIPHLANWVHPNCFLGTPLVARGFEVQFWRALIAWADLNPSSALFLHLHQVALEGPLHAALRQVLAADGRPWGVVKREDRPLLAAGLDAAAYLRAALPDRKRKDLDRRFRKLCEFGEVGFRWQRGAEEIEQWSKDFLALEASGWKGAAGSALGCDPGTARLLREALAGAARRGRLTRLSLTLDDRPIAMLSTFTTPPGAYGFKTAFNEDYARFSPGFLVEREFLSALDQGEFAWCDSCAASDHSVMSRIWRERRPVGWLSIAIGGSWRRAAFEQLLRKECPELTPEFDHERV